MIAPKARQGCRAKTIHDAPARPRTWQSKGNVFGQRCMMAMYRFIGRGQVLQERRGNERVWRLAR